MKKISLTLLPFLALPLLSGCGSSHKISLVYGKLSDNDLTVVNYTKLSEMIEDEKQTFILTISPKSNCSCWNTFKTILASYAQDTHVNVYNIGCMDFYNSESVLLNTFGLSVKQDRETFAIFEDGKLVQHRVYDQKDYIFSQQQTFREYMSEVVNLPTIFEISLSQLQEFYASGEETVVYFSRNNCGDCSYVDMNYLKEYGKANLDMKPLYVLDCEKIGIREYDDNNQLTPESAVKWQAFKDTYGLSTVNNATYGYGTGYVPTFQLIKGNGVSYASSIVSSSVYFNDSVSIEDNKYVVTDSFYTEERKTSLQYLEGIETTVLKGLELSEDDVSVIEWGGNKYVMWKHESAEKYHTPLLKGFLDYTLAQVK